MILMLLAKDWKEYECLEIGDYYKIERFGNYIFKRPEPTAKAALKHKDYHFDGQFENGQWKHQDLPDNWIIHYKNMKLLLSPSSYKHLGVFPEQAVNWDFIQAVSKRQDTALRVLNLFGYTGAATIAASLGNVEEVVHIDALKSAIKRTQDNIRLNHLESKKIRTMVDDVIKFLEREKRRGKTYHAIIMDPPSFGRGPKGEVWKIEEQLNRLVNLALDVLDPDAVYLILNTYSQNLSHQVVKETLEKAFKKHHIHHGYFDSHKIGVPISHGNASLQLGSTTRWCLYEDLLK